MLRNNADVRRCSYFELGLPVLFHVRSWKKKGLLTRPFSPIQCSFITVNKSSSRSNVIILKMPFDGLFCSSSSFGRPKVAFAWVGKDEVQFWAIDYITALGRVKALFASSAGYSFFEIIARVGGEISRRVVWYPREDWEQVKLFPSQRTARPVWRTFRQERTRDITIPQATQAIEMKKVAVGHISLAFTIFHDWLLQSRLTRIIKDNLLCCAFKHSYPLFLNPPPLCVLVLPCISARSLTIYFISTLFFSVKGRRWLTCRSRQNRALKVFCKTLP